MFPQIEEGLSFDGDDDDGGVYFKSKNDMNQISMEMHNLNANIGNSWNLMDGLIYAILLIVCKRCIFNIVECTLFAR